MYKSILWRGLSKTMDEIYNVPKAKWSVSEVEGKKIMHNAFRDYSHKFYRNNHICIAEANSGWQLK
jgi:hypothetical protein